MKILIFSMKIIIFFRHLLIKKTNREIKIMQELRHPNIVELEAVVVRGSGWVAVGPFFFFFTLLLFNF
jgi:serine/threonine protein kinase